MDIFLFATGGSSYTVSCGLNIANIILDLMHGLPDVGEVLRPIAFGWS